METTTKIKKITLFTLVIMLLGALSLYFFNDPLNTDLFPKCPFYSITGFYCPGCGSQRAIHAILHGHIFEGLQHNFLIVLLFLVLCYDFILKLIFILKKKSLNNVLHSPRTTNSILIVILLFWIFRNITIYPFTYLAP